MPLTMDAPQRLEERLQSIRDELLSVLRHSRSQRRAVVRNVPTRHILPERVPDDVLREIFHVCRQDIDGIPTMDTNEIPMVLTRVSSRWRNVALTTPRLWNAIHIPIVNVEAGDEKGQSIMRGRLKEISDWVLCRSGALPLRISVYQQSHCDRNNPLAAGIVDVLMQCRARWQYLDLSGISNILPLVSVDPSSVPLLQGLRIVHFEDNIDPLDQNLEGWHTGQVLTAPALRRFSAISTAQSFSTCQINWSRLTHLSFANCNSSRNDDHRFTFPALVNVLRRTPQLFSLVFHDTIREIDPTRVTAIRGPKIRLPSLEVLDVRESPSVKMASLLYILVVPSLVDLTYMYNVIVRCDYPGGGDHAVSAFRILLARSSGKIRRLKTNILHVYTTLMDHLSFCPALTILELMPHPCIYDPDTRKTYCTISDNLLAVLSNNDPAHQNPCPNLEYLRCLTHSTFSSDAIIAFSRQRKLAGDISGTRTQFVLHIDKWVSRVVHLTADNWDPRTFQLIYERPYRTGFPMPKYSIDLGLDRAFQNCPLVI